MNLEEAIFKIVMSQFTLYHSCEAKITKVNETDKTCTVFIDGDKDNKVENVRWLSPGIPKLNTKCYVVYLNNLFKRPVAISIKEFKSLQFSIGEANEIEISDTNAKFKFQDVTIEKTGTSLEIKNSSGLTLTMNNTSNKWIVEGKTEFADDVLIKGKLDVDKEVAFKDELVVDKDITWDNATTPTHAKTHIHSTTAPGTPTGPAAPGG